MPGQAPSGWEPEDPLQPFGGVGMFGWRCERFSLGGFERPLWFVLDSHSNFNIPPACQLETEWPTSTLVLSTLVVNDAEVASTLNRTFGMPVRFGEISETLGGQAGAYDVHEWTWTPEGMQPSRISVYDDSFEGVGSPEALRFFWPIGERLGYLQITFEANGPIFTSRLATAALAEPMLLADWYADGAFAGPGDWYPEATAEGEFRFFADHECTKPVPP
ncbi:MAG: hypothetical protein ACYC2H_11960 [Thermoplasmatota archaeon]